MKFKNPLILAFLYLALASMLFAQASVSSTTLTLSAGRLDPCLTVGSTTSMTAPGTLNQATTILFIDKEPMSVTSVPSSTQVCVNRDSPSGTAMPHAANAIVWFGPQNYFVAQDPSGSCTPSGLVATPRINTTNGRVWTCFKNGQTVNGTGLWAQEKVTFVSPVHCGSLGASGVSMTDNGMVPAATGNVVHQFTSNTSAGTTQITCSLGLPGNIALNSGQSTWLGDVSLLYGAQTTAISSIATAQISSVIYPTSTAAGATAAGTVAAIGGTLSVTPSTLQLGTTTSGRCYNEQITLGTPYLLNVDNSQVTIDQVFTDAGSTATVYQVCGVLVHTYTVAPSY